MNRLSKNGYTLIKKVEDNVRKLSDVPYPSGKMNYIDNEKFIFEKNYQNTKEEERQLRTEFRIYCSSLDSPLKLLEIQRLLNSRITQKDKTGTVVRDNETGVIQYKETFQKESYQVYLKKTEKIKVETVLVEGEYKSVVIYSNMIDEAEGRTFLAKAKVQNYDELSELIKR